MKTLLLTAKVVTLICFWALVAALIYLIAEKTLLRGSQVQHTAPPEIKVWYT